MPTHPQQWQQRAAADAWPTTGRWHRCHARWRQSPEDFRVDEDLGFAATGEGEFALLRIEKRSANTAFVAERLAAFCELPSRAVSFSGLKDRHAVTRQWFSVHLPGRPSPDFQALRHAEFRVLESHRHARKLRRGSHRGNRFEIVLRRVEDGGDAFEAALDTLGREGFPNYFGPQRFGRGGANVARACDRLAGRRRSRRPDSLALSAARSLIFNAVLARRVEEGSWNRLQDGDVAGLDGSASIFPCAEVDAELASRCSHGDLHPTGPLWGRGSLLAAAGVSQLEHRCADEFEVLARGLERQGAKAARRPLRCLAGDLEWQRDGDSWTLGFGLPRGAFATALLRELIDLVADDETMTP